MGYRYTAVLRSKNGITYRAVVVLPNKKVFNFGRFLTEEEAHQAALKAKREVEEGVFDPDAHRIKGKIEVNGKALWAYEWAEILGVHPSSLSRAAKESGWTVEEEVRERITLLQQG